MSGEVLGDAGADPDWYVPTAFEVAGGWVHGRTPLPDPAPEWPAESPAAALRAVLREHILRGPCVVPFSGGRDSSLVLAVACSVAREAGAPLPAAATFRHPGVPESDESDWQDLVMAHLARLGMAPEWHLRDITDELDIVGPLAAPLLARCRHSVWPPNIATVLALAQDFPGATLLSGEYGDGVLGVRRVTVVAGLVRSRGRGMPARHWRAAAQCLTPRVVAAGATRLGGASPRWLNARGRRLWRQATAADALADRFRYDRSVRDTPAWRGPRLGLSNLGRVSHEHGCRFAAPLAHPRVLAALADHGRWHGPQSRGYATALLGGDLLPERLYRRDTKANFTESRFNRHAIATVDAWKDTEISREWVDGEQLRAAWGARSFHPQMAGLVQDQWLAQQGLR